VVPSIQVVVYINDKEKKMKKLMVLVAALALVAGSAMSVAAAEWNFYGSARVATWMDNESEDYSQALQGNSRIGANVKASDSLTGRFELGIGEPGPLGIGVDPLKKDNNDVTTRIIWGEWNFGAGSLGVGKHYTPLNFFTSNQVFDGDTNLLPYGGVYSARNTMLRLKFGGFEIAAVKPQTKFSDSEVDYPAVEASYTLQMDAFKVTLGGGYQSYDEVDSYIVAAEGRANFGLGYLGGNVYVGENAGDLIWISTGGSDGKGTATQDVDNMGFVLVAGMKATDMFSFEAGYGWAEVDNDIADDEVKSYYIQSTITLAPGVFITPEIGKVDFVEAGQGDFTYYGAKWQINF
jgi:hypothetical protein